MTNSDGGVQAYFLEELFSQCDIVCICCTLSPKTTGMINKSLLTRPKEGACLINTSRGEVANEQDPVVVLETRPDLRVGLDVLVGEVTDTHLGSPLLAMHGGGQIVITPHIAGATLDSQMRYVEMLQAGP